MLKIPAYLLGFSSRADKSAGIRFGTQELNGDTFAELQELNGTFGWLIYSETSLKEEDIPKKDPESKNKSQSQRIRAVLYKIHIQQGGKPENWESFYHQKTEKYIEYLKSKLDL